MSTEPKILWTEGLFLCPQTFQQQERFSLDWAESRTAPIEPHFWGIIELGIDDAKLDNGTFSLRRCRGIFPDGTPFDTKGSVLEHLIGDDERNQYIYLSLGARQGGVHEVTTEQQRQTKRTSRHYVQEQQYLDVQTLDSPQKTELLQVGRLNFQLRLAEKPLDNFTQIPLAFLRERHKGGRAILDDAFIPPTLFTHASPVIRKYIQGIQAQLMSRGDMIAARLSNPSTGGVSDIVDFNMLLIMNRHLRLFDFLAIEERVHPRQLYVHAIQMAGELATFARPDRRPRAYPSYNHDDLRLTFLDLFDDIHEYLQYSAVPKALCIPLIQHEKYPVVYGSKLLAESVFREHVRYILAASASLPLGDLQQRIPRVTKIASTLDHLSELVRTHTTGVNLRALTSVPREVPYYTTSVYFELGITSDNVHWQKIQSSRYIHLHVDGEMPDLKLEIWAIRGDQK